MRIPQDKLAKIKNYVHSAQAVIIAVAWLMCIIIFTRDGDSDGRIGWYFGLVSIQAQRLDRSSLTILLCPVLVIYSHLIILGNGTNVVSNTTLLQRLCICDRRRPVNNLMAQCVGSHGIIRLARERKGRERGGSWV